MSSIRKIIRQILLEGKNAIISSDYRIVGGEKWENKVTLVDKQRYVRVKTGARDYLMWFAGLVQSKKTNEWWRLSVATKVNKAFADNFNVSLMEGQNDLTEIQLNKTGLVYAWFDPDIGLKGESDTDSYAGHGAMLSHPSVTEMLPTQDELPSSSYLNKMIQPSYKFLKIVGSAVKYNLHNMEKPIDTDEPKLSELLQALQSYSNGQKIDTLQIDFFEELPTYSQYPSAAWVYYEIIPGGKLKLVNTP